MKRCLTGILTLLLIWSLTACALSSAVEPVEFFYPCKSAPDSIPDTVIGSEMREATGHTGDLNYLLSLYLQGPHDPELLTPFPAGCRLLSVTWNGDTLVVTLDSTITALGQMQRTVASACIAKTCFGLTDVAQVQVKAAAPEQSDSLGITITPENLLENMNLYPTEENP